ncbi:MAG: hypothetical protein IPP81_09565 [Chitinophagaceae bacterium]|nr:hypothetical protein [Chitinophagaceae bacterium]
MDNKKERIRFEGLNVELTGKETTNAKGNIGLSFEINGVDGTFKTFNSTTGEPIESNYMVTGYIGENKWRTTTKINSAEEDYTHSLEQKINRYNHIFAIDTNTKLISNILFPIATKISVGVGVKLEIETNSFVVATIEHPFLASHNSDKPENENWMNLIDVLKDLYLPTDKIGIVVDSDLGNIDEFNSRKKTIFKDYFLPESFELIFASDKVNDNIFNQMIRRCHYLSDFALQKMEENMNEELNKIVAQH